MTFTYDLSTDIGKVRLIISDTVQAKAIFTDEEINAFLSMNESNVKLAAAGALDTMASSQAMILKVIRLLDLSTDGAAVARALREHANQLRSDADKADANDGGLFDYAEMVTNDFTARQRLRNQVLRGEE